MPISTMNTVAYKLSKIPDVTAVRIRGEARITRAPIHFIAIIDNSGSMEDDNKINNVIKSIHYMLDLLSPDDEVSVITFNSATQVIANQVKMTSEQKVALRHKISAIHADGGTNLSSGILAARECIRPNENTIKQGILLLTDGHANYGVTSVSGIEGCLSSVIREFPGVTCTTVGYGTDHNADLLRSLATVGSGSYNIVANLEDVATVFGDVLGGMHSCVCQRAKVTVPLSNMDAVTDISAPSAGTSAITQITKYISTRNTTHLTIELGDVLAYGDYIILLRGLKDGDRIQYSGYDIEFGSHAELDDIVLAADAESAREHQLTGYIAYLRIQVADLMDEVRKDSAIRAITDEKKAAYLQRIQTLSDTIQTTQSEQATPNPVLTLLQSEIDICREIITRPPADIEATHHVMTQHSMFLSAGRGICSVASPTVVRVQNSTYGIEACLSANTSVFSTDAQRHTSAALKTATLIPHDPTDESEMDPSVVTSVPPSGGIVGRRRRGGAAGWRSYVPPRTEMAADPKNSVIRTGATDPSATTDTTDSTDAKDLEDEMDTIAQNIINTVASYDTKMEDVD